MNIVDDVNSEECGMWCAELVKDVIASRGGQLSDYYIPESLWFKKVVANMENYDDESFKYAVVRSLNPVEKNPQWIIADLKKQTEEYNWDGISFPTPLSQIETFEKNNGLLVNVFRWDEFGERAYPIRIPYGPNNPRALLILIDECKGHYVVIKSMHGLFRKQTGRGGRTFYYNNCMAPFSKDETLQKHIVSCDRSSYSFFEMKKVEKTTISKPSPPRPNAGRVNWRSINNMKCNDDESFK